MKHSDQKRTLHTARVVLAGAYNIPIPTTKGELQSLEFQNFLSKEEPGLSYTSLDINFDAIKSMGEEAYLEWLVKNPNSEELDGKRVTPWNQMLRSGRNSLKDAITYANMRTTPLGIIVSHSGLTEPLVLAAVNTGRQIPLTDPREIGGWIPMEGYAILSLEGNSGEVQRNGEKYRVDLSNL